MQLFALDDAFPLGAAHAEKGKNYHCPECKAIVRVRSGQHRQIHFYHLSRPQNCRQHQKSQEHLQFQLKMLAEIGESHGQLEYAFPSIGRIADIAWHSQKIVFEIQCSPIAAEEAKARCSDYLSQGYRVVWILHTKRFNKGQLSAAELFLRSTPCYFTDIDRNGKGEVYDQFEIIKGGRRLFKGPPLSVCLTQIETLPEVVPPDLALPQIVLERLSRWKCYARGDLLHRLLLEGNLSLSAKRMLAAERRYSDQPTGKKRLPFRILIAKSYKAVLHLFLKSLSKNP